LNIICRAPTNSHRFKQSLQPDQKKGSANFSGRYAVTDTSQIYAEGSFSHVETLSNFQSVPLSYQNALPASNPYNAFLANLLATDYPNYHNPALTPGAAAFLLPPTSPYYPTAFATAAGLNGQPLNLIFRDFVNGSRLNEDTSDAARFVTGQLLPVNGGFVVLPADNVLTIEPEDVFTSVPPVRAANAPFRELIEDAAARYRVDSDLIASVISAESNFNPRAISRRNARGLMQLLPETAARLGIQNIFDPRENIDAGTRYLRDLLLLYKNDLALTLAAYNAGPRRVHQYGRVPPFAETQSYVRRVGSAYAKRKSGVPAGKPSITAPAASTVTSSAQPSGQM